MPDSKYIINGSSLTSIANAIRTKTGSNGNLTFPTGFVSAIGGISGGDDIMVVTLTYDWNLGNYSANKTISEINTAIQAGKVIFLYYNDTDEGIGWCSAAYYYYDGNSLADLIAKQSITYPEDQWAGTSAYTKTCTMNYTMGNWYVSIDTIGDDSGSGVTEPVEDW